MRYLAEISGEISPRQGPSERSRASAPGRLARTDWWIFLKDTYASADPRSLGLLRILLGVVVLLTALGRLGDVSAHLSDDGWLPRAVAFEHDVPWSVCRWFGSATAMRVFLYGTALVALCLCVGIKTRVMQILALVLVASLNGRNTVIENGGMTALIWLLLISAFLPLGARFSWDSARVRRARPKVRERPVVSLAVSALVLQWGAIYWFNYAHKSGATWEDGTALHYFLHQDQAVTRLGVLAREALPGALTGIATAAARTSEGAIALLLLLPFSSGKARILAWALAFVLHVSIALVLDLGVFSWVMLAGFSGFLRGSTWDAAAERWPRARAWFDRVRASTRRRLGPDQRKIARRTARAALSGRGREALVACVIVVQLFELAATNRALPEFLRIKDRPAWLARSIGPLRLFQEWSLCAPDPPLENRRLVAVATAANGRAIDPLTGEPPRFDGAPLREPRGQAWDEVHRRLGERRRLWPGFARFLRIEAERKFAPVPLQSLALYWVIAPIASPGRPKALGERRLLFSE